MLKSTVNLKALVLPALLSASLLTGCAGQVSNKVEGTINFAFEYDETQSYALNMLRASGVPGVTDVALPNELTAQQKEDLQASAGELLGDAFDAAFLGGAAAGAITMPGIGSTGALAFGALDLLNTPILPGGAQVNSFSAWMPASMAESGEEAHQLAKNTMVDAMKQAGEAEGFATVYDPSRFGRFSAGNSLIVILERPEAGCPTAASRKTMLDLCYISAWVFPPRLIDTPERVAGHNEAKSYGFATSMKTSKSYMPSASAELRESGFAEQAMMHALSKHLPVWFNLYLGKEGTKTANGEPIPFPYVLKGGKAHLFLKP